MLVDTHAHLDFPDFGNELDAILARAAAAGVTRVITIGTTVEGSRRAIALAERFPNVFATVGVHPSNADEADDHCIAELRTLAAQALSNAGASAPMAAWCSVARTGSAATKVR